MTNTRNNNDNCLSSDSDNEKRGKRFYEARIERLNLTLETMAEKLDVSSWQSVQAWEKGTYSPRDLPGKCRKYAELTGWQIAYFLDPDCKYHTKKEEEVEKLRDHLRQEPENKRKEIIVDLLASYGGIREMSVSENMMIVKRQNNNVCLEVEISQNDLDNMIKQIDDVVSLYLDQYIVNHTEPSQEASVLAEITLNPIDNE